MNNLFLSMKANAAVFIDINIIMAVPQVWCEFVLTKTSSKVWCPVVSTKHPPWAQNNYVYNVYIVRFPQFSLTEQLVSIIYKTVCIVINASCRNILQHIAYKFSSCFVLFFPCSGAFLIMHLPGYGLECNLWLVFCTFRNKARN